MTSKEQQFWDWFVANETTYYNAGKDDIDLFSLLEEELIKVCKVLTFELSIVPDTSIKELCISADGMKSCFPSVIELVRVAPSLSNWKIRAFRQRIHNDNILIALDDFDLSYDDIYFLYAQDNGKISLELYIRDFDNSDQFLGAVFTLLDALLGEYDVATQLSTIEWHSLKEDEIPILSPFLLLRNLVDRNKALKN